MEVKVNTKGVVPLTPVKVAIRVPLARSSLPTTELNTGLERFVVDRCFDHWLVVTVTTAVVDAVVDIQIRYGG